MKALCAVGVVAVAALSGCTSMSGYDAKSDFSCKAPDGVLCESMSGVYANAMANNLPGQKVNHGKEVSPAKAQGTASGVMTKPIYSGTPIRTAPVILRVWFAPWEDSDGDLHDQSYVYLPVDTGKWLIEHNRRRIQDAYRPAKAPQTQVSGADAAAKAKIKVDVGQPASVNDEPQAQPQSAQELLNGLLRPGMPGSPAQIGDQ